MREIKRNFIKRRGSVPEPLGLCVLCQDRPRIKHDFCTVFQDRLTHKPYDVVMLNRVCYTYRMRFPLIDTGKRFFFFTFTVEGRRDILSTLIRGEQRPRLSLLGKRIEVYWKHLHHICPQFTASYFIIMPDHVHLLLMVDSQDTFRFNPLVFAHWFQMLTAQPCALESIPRYILENAPSRWDEHLPDIVLTPTENTFYPTEFIPWAQEAWINISFDARQLAAIRRYIKMNPVRYFWKVDHPDLFRARRNLKHPRLNTALTWTSVGDLTLLASPFLFLVRLTRKKTLEELESEIEAALARAQQGWIPICGFLSPGERLFGQRLKTLPRTRWIKTVPYGLPERYDPSVEDSQWIARRRQLILSSFDSAAFPPFQITRAGCLLMNERIVQMVDTLC